MPNPRWIVLGLLGAEHWASGRPADLDDRRSSPMLLTKPDTVSKRIVHFHLLAPRLANDTGSAIFIMLGDELCMEVSDVIHPHEGGGTGAGVAMVLRQMQF